MGKKKKKVESSDPPVPSPVPLSTQEKEELAFRIEKKRGNEYYKQDYFEGAILCYSKAIIIFPEKRSPELLVSVLTNRAIAYLRLKKYDLCVEDCTAALSIDDTYVKSLICRAFGHFYLQNYENSLQDYETALKLQPANQSLQKNIQKAKEILLQRAKQDPTKNKKLEVQWVGDFGLNIEEEFIPSHLLKPFLTSKGKGPEEKGKEVDAQQKKKDFSEEPPLLIPIGEVLPRNALVHIPETKREAEQIAIQEKELGNKAFQAGDFLVALTHYSKAIKLNPDDSVFFANRALVYLKIARYYESITDSSASIDRKPNIKAYARRASAWSFLKEYQAASEDYKKALSFEPTNKDCLSELETCLKQLLKEYTVQAQLDPSNIKLKKLIKATQEDIDKVVSAKSDSKVAVGPSTPLQKH